jgi:hypothetical protein
MPICPRCGKCLSSEQALTYHLNRKYKCGTWNCTKCATNFSTKFQLQIHEMSCIGDREQHKTGYMHPSTDTLLKIYNSIPMIIMELDTVHKNIVNISPQCEHLLGIKQEHLLGLTLPQGIKLINNNPNYEHKLNILNPELVCVSIHAVIPNL